MVDQANSVIDMLLMNLRDNTVDKRQFGIYSAAECLQQAVDRYCWKLATPRCSSRLEFPEP